MSTIVYEILNFHCSCADFAVPVGRFRKGWDYTFSTRRHVTSHPPRWGNSRARNGTRVQVFFIVVMLGLVSEQASGLLRYLSSSFHSSATIRKFLLALYHDRRQRSFNTTTSWWKQSCKMIWDLTWHLSQCGSVVFMKSQIKLISETLRFPQSKNSGYCCTQSKICSSLQYLPQSVELEYQRSAPYVQFFQHIPRIPNSSSWSIVCACVSFTIYQSWIHSMKSLHWFAQIGRKIERKISYLLQMMINQSDFLLSTPVNLSRGCEQSDTLWGHGQLNSYKKTKNTQLVRIVVKREFTWYW